MQIKKKIPILLVMFICIPLLFLAGGIYHYSSKLILYNSKQAIKQLARVEAKAFSTLLEEKRYEVQLLATDSQIISAAIKADVLGKDIFYNSKDYKDAKQVVQRAIEVSKDLYASKIVNKNGEVIISTKPDVLGINVGERRYFKQALKGEVVFSDVLVSEIDNSKSMAVAAPIKSGTGEILGVACITISNKVFGDFIEKIKIGESGYGYLVDGEGYLIAHPIAQKEGQLVENEKVRGLIEQIKNNKEVTNDIMVYHYNGKNKYLGFEVIPERNWILCIAQNTEEIYFQVYRQLFIMLIVVIVLISMIAIASMSLTTSICEPIDQLILTMEEVEKGNLNSFCNYSSKNEFGKLVDSYNAMIKALSQSQEALKTSEEQYRLTLDALDEAIWEYSIEDKRFTASKKFSEIMGCTIQSIDDKNFIDNMLLVDYARSFKKAFNDCLKGIEDRLEQELLFKIPHTDEKRWVFCRARVIRNGNKIEKFIGAISDITPHKNNEEKVRNLVYFDTLTGLLNKQIFMEILKEWLKPGSDTNSAALIFIDLDNFKNINDTLGHEKGDKLLTLVAQQLKQFLPSDTLICRFGGDEFVIFKTNFKNLEEITELARDLLRVISEGSLMDEMLVHISCSMGIALYPTDGSSYEVLLKNADTAMHRAKATGKNKYNFYDENMSKILDRKLIIERILREAIDARYLYLQYQPIIDLKTGSIVAAEALLRVKAENIGFVSPDEFIPIAEETGLIIPIGEWVFERSIEELEKMRKLGYEEMEISINVSSIQLKQPDFLGRIKEIINRHQVPTHRIKLEITESVLIENLDENINVFKKIKDMGMKIALDDFGTGYSSLNYLRIIPFDILKIDKSFIDEIVQSQPLAEIVDSIISMAHSLNIQVVTEGVETKEQLAIIEEKGCDMVQGYIFSKPLLPIDLREFIQHFNKK
ncbi:EAL domain-containing protein [Sporanaerobium hydrogeniformans]|uniref:EAL domain-containing protein n=1 Tax=Sporanaerobium hydrogeniformans TaxID=3072179 RepID=UPI0015D50F1D|nr:EAL domain-containing protein [Sporanaerobium hydrogeniformans]